MIRVQLIDNRFNPFITMFTPRTQDPHAFSLEMPIMRRLRRKLILRKLAKLEMKRSHVPVAILPTYTHVQECEAELFQKFDVQSSSILESIDTENVDLAINTIHLIKILTTEGMMSSPGSMISAIQLYMCAITGKTNIEMLGWVIDKCRSFYEALTLTIQSEPEDENPVIAHLKTLKNPFERIRAIFKKWSLVKTHPLAQKLTSMMHHILAASLLERFGITYDTFFFSKAEKEASLRAHSSNFGLVETLLDGTTYILERLWDVLCTGSWTPFLHTGDAYGKWVDSVYMIKERSTLLHAPKAHGFELHQFISDVDTALERGSHIIQYGVDMDKSICLSAKKLMADLRMIKAELTTRAFSRAQREAPFGVLFFGGSGLGKSTLLNAFQSYFGRLFDLPMGDEYSYTRNFEEEYYSGFNSSMWNIILDDVAARNPNMKDDRSLNEVISLMNNVCYCPPQAELADKGKTPVRTKLVMATTNVKTLNASAYFCSSLAIQRRLPYVISTYVNPEFAVDPEAQPYDRMLDASKTNGEEVPDYWTFKVEKVAAEPGTQQDMPQRAMFRQVSPPEGWNIYQLLKYLGTESKRHFANQRLMMDSREKLQNMSVCKTCLQVSTHCECELTTQSFPEEVSWYWVVGLLVFQCLYMNIEKLLSRFVSWAVRKMVAMIIRRIRLKIMGWWFTLCYRRDYVSEVRAKLLDSALSAKERLELERVRVRAQFVRAGEAIRSQKLTNQHLAALVIALPTLLVVYKTYKSWQALDLQGSTVEGSRLPDKGEEQNVWMRNTYEPSSFEVGTLTKSWKSLSFDEAAKVANRNVIHVTSRFELDGKRKFQVFRALALGGQLYVTNSHCVDMVPELDFTVVTTSAVEGIGGNFTIKMDQSQFFRIPGCDIVFFRLANMPPRRKLTELLCAESFRTVCNGVKLLRDENGVERTLPVRGLRYVITDALGYPSPGWRGESPADTANGECGAPLLAQTPMGPVLLGLHQQGGKMCVNISVQLTREHVELAQQHYGCPEIEACEPHLKDENELSVQIGPIHHKSPTRYINEGTANVYGSFIGFRPSHKSQVTDTYIRKEMEELGHEVKTGAPIMKGWKPWYAATKDIVQQQFNAKQSDIDACADAFADDILAGLSDADLKELVVLDDLSTVNGIPGVKYIDKMKRDTSMGWPWRSKKRNFLSEPHCVEVWQDAVDFDDKFYARVNRIIERYQKGSRHMPVYTGHLKDEPTKFSKIESGLTRVFCGAPADWSFVVRKYLLSFVRVMQNNKLLFEAAPGLNATSFEWEALYTYLTAHGVDQMIAGDFSKFDKNMSAQWILAAYKVIDRVLEAAGWSLEDRRIVQCIGYDTAFPLCDMNGDVVEFWGSNPSGQPLTVIINCLVNSMYMRYVWKQIGNDLSEFKKFVNLITYGDDNTMGVSPLHCEFNHTTIQSELGKIGIKYTMADKETESKPFISMSEISFLKRSFTYHSDLDTVVATLELDSISKSLTKCLPSKVLSPEAHSVEVMKGALREYFLYGREMFEDWKGKFELVADQKGLRPFLSEPFPSYAELITAYEANPRDVRL